MALDTLPVLDASYPLYDWADWQSSRDALVSGTPTRYFAKEAWNAIVDDLNDALSAAGLSWDNEYTTAAGAKITVAYGKLTAKKFNSVRHNIHVAAPLRWAWAWDERFRGYVGRENFLGREDVGKKCDKVYPEYIIELVRRLNLLIELMRGTAPDAAGDAPYLATLHINREVVAGTAARIQTDHLSTVDQEIQLRLKTGNPTVAEHKSSVQTLLDGAVTGTLPFRLSKKTYSYLSASGRTITSMVIKPEGVTSPSLVLAEMEHNKCIDTEGSVATETRINQDVDLLPSVDLDDTTLTFSTSTVEVAQSDPMPCEAETTVQSSSDVTSITKRRLLLGARGILGTQRSMVLNKPQSRVLEAAKHVATKRVAYLDTAWYPPVWVDGGLWIRQSHNVTQNENGELVIL